MAENKTKATDASVDDYIASRASEQQYDDCVELIALLKRVTRQPPKMWGPSIIGSGKYRYTYESGRTGEAPLAAFAIRGREIVVYLQGLGPKEQRLLAKAGKFKLTKGCFYFKRLADIDKRVLQQLVAASVAATKKRYARAT